MQPPFSCAPHIYSAIERSFSRARLGRYIAEASGDKNLALRLHVWNARIAEAMYLPLQIAEVAFRNTVANTLSEHFAPEWWKVSAFRCTLPQRLSAELDGAIRDERARYGPSMSGDHIVSALPLGFWVHLLTKPYQGVLWPRFFPSAFPNKPQDVNREACYNRWERLRKFRNKAAHYKPIFDQKPGGELNNILEVTGWICHETQWFVKTISTVGRTLNQKPADPAPATPRPQSE